MISFSAEYFFASLPKIIANGKATICVSNNARRSPVPVSYTHLPGIDPEDMEQIFEPGFSTKINYETGEVNRGLGLSLVKDFIELRLGGTIRVTSVPGKTVFTLTIPKEKWSGL